MSEDRRPSAPRARWGVWTLALVIVGVTACPLLAAFGQTRYAVVVLAATCAGLGTVRLAVRGRPWFSSRGRVADASVLFVIAALLTYLAVFTSILDPA